MNKAILEAIERKTGVRDLAGLLAGRLSGSELSSLLLAVYEQRTEKMRPVELLAEYRRNRLVQPADVDMIALRESELATLRFLRDRGFAPVELSPVAVLGSCSVVAAVSQDKVVSAVRNTEVVADATNMLALHAAELRRGLRGARGEEGSGPGRSREESEINRFCTVHRHVRTQPLRDKRFRPHFVIGCMVSAGRDNGGYAFECAEMARHLGDYVALLREVYGVARFRVMLKRRGGYDGRNPPMLIDRMESWLRERLAGVEIGREEAPAESAYYQGVQFKLYIPMDGGEWEIADGGFVDWTQRLLENKKERLLISGFGLEMLVKSRCGRL
jgi:hypothetical protein